MNRIIANPTYHVVPFPAERNATIDTLRWAKKRYLIPSLLEVDVTQARRAVREIRRRSGQGLSFTAWVVSCVARAAAEHPRVHALRRGRREIVEFDDVDVAVLVERKIRGDERATLPMPVVIRTADRKRPQEIHEEIRKAQDAEFSEGSASIEPHSPGWIQSLFFRLPAWIRDILFWRWLLRSPLRTKRTMGTVVVTSVGTAAPGVLAWGIPLSLHPLAVAVGGIVGRGEGIDRSEVLALTVVFDHAVVDGAPVGRFIHRLQELLSHVEVLPDGSSGPVGGTSADSAVPAAPGYGV